MNPPTSEPAIAEQRRHDEPSGVAPRREELGDDAHDEAEQDPQQDRHGFSPQEIGLLPTCRRGSAPFSHCRSCCRSDGAARSHQREIRWRPACRVIPVLARRQGPSDRRERDHSRAIRRNRGPARWARSWCVMSPRPVGLAPDVAVRRAAIVGPRRCRSRAETRPRSLRTSRAAVRRRTGRRRRRSGASSAGSGTRSRRSSWWSRDLDPIERMSDRSQRGLRAKPD